MYLNTMRLLLKETRLGLGGSGLVIDTDVVGVRIGGVGDLL